MQTFTGTSGNEALSGGTGDKVLSGFGREDTLNGGAGGDAADYQEAPAAIEVNLALGTARDGYGSTDALISIEQVGGTAFADTITGHSGSNHIEGRDGADLFSAAGGDDLVVYDKGDDTAINMTGGGWMVLMGVQMSTLTSGRIFGA